MIFKLNISKINIKLSIIILIGNFLIIIKIKYAYSTLQLFNLE